ncbi:MAG: phage tail protein [bacterium]|nr:phage tail protein [bacterium]
MGQIIEVGFTYCPRGFMECNGQLLAISQYQALFSLLSTNYGGDGRTTFALPDLRGRSAVHVGRGPGLQTYSLGMSGGSEYSTLGSHQMPSHTHTATVNAYSSEGDAATPVNNVWAKSGQGDPDYNSSGNATMQTGAVTLSNSGGSQSHNNMPPFLGIRHCIAVEGIYPSRPF